MDRRLLKQIPRQRVSDYYNIHMQNVIGINEESIL
jgi:hypothetical protein